MKYVNTFTDRYGRRRSYYRRFGYRIALPGALRTPEFQSEYDRLRSLTAIELLSEAQSPVTRARQFPIIDVIYFIADQREIGVKIGFTRNLNERLRVLQNYSPLPLLVQHFYPGTIKDEFELHKRFADYRVHGEWFRDRDGKISAFIERTKNENGTTNDKLEKPKWQTH